MLWIDMPTGIAETGIALPGFGFHVGAADDPHPRLQAFGSEDVSQLAVVVLDERDSARSVRIVLDVRHLGADAVLGAAEVDDTVHPLVTAAAETDRGLALVVPPAVAVQRREKALFGLLLTVGDLGEIAHRSVPSSGARRFEMPDSHGLFLCRP